MSAWGMTKAALRKVCKDNNGYAARANVGVVSRAGVGSSLGPVTGAEIL